jgi:hypothetical protein
MAGLISGLILMSIFALTILVTSIWNEITRSYGYGFWNKFRWVRQLSDWYFN